MFKKKNSKNECKCKKRKRKCRNFYLMRDPLNAFKWPTERWKYLSRKVMKKKPDITKIVSHL